MSSVGNLAAARRPESGWRSDHVWSDLELPGWQDFTEARERFFAGLRGLDAPRVDEAAEGRPAARGGALDDDTA